MACRTKFNNHVNSVLTFEAFDESKYSQDTKTEIFKSLHNEDVVKSVGLPGKGVYSFIKNTNNEAAMLVKNYKIIDIPAKNPLSFLEDPYIKHETNIKLNTTKVEKIINSKLDPSNEVDALILGALKETSAKINTLESGKSDAEIHSINISFQTIDNLSKNTNISKEAAAKQIILHELVHSNTIATLELANSTELTPDVIRAKEQSKELLKLWGKYKNAIKTKPPFIDPITQKPIEYSVEEFLANAISSKEFQTYLNTSSPSLLNTLIDFIKRLLNVTLADRVMDEYLSIMENDIVNRFLVKSSNTYGFSVGEAEYYTKADHGKSNIPLQLLKLAKDISIIRNADGTESDFYSVAGRKTRRMTSQTGVSARHSSTKALTMEEVNEIVASNNWDRFGIERSQKLPLGLKGTKVDAQELINFIEESRLKSSLKGRIVHFHLEKAAAKKAGIMIDSNIQETYDRDWAKYIELEKEESKLDFNWVDTIADKYFENLQLNLDSDNKVTGSTVILEMPVHSKILDFVSTIDIFAQRNIDGKIMLVDSKNGSKVLDDSFKRILNEYSTSYLPIFDTARDKAKLELMLRAIAIKEQFPDAQFSQLRIGNIQDGDQAQITNPKDIVDVNNYLTFLKKLYKNKKLTDELGLSKPEDTESLYDRLVAASPLIFEPSEYYDNVDGNLKANNTSDAKDNLTDMVATLKDKVANNYFSNVYEVKKEIADLTESILRVSQYSDSQWDKEFGDLGVIASKLGNWQEANDPAVRTFAKEYYGALNAMDREMSDYKIRMDKATTDLHNEYRATNKGINLGPLLRKKIYTNTAGTGIYDFAYKKQTIDGITTERLVLPKDDEWKSLLPAQKAFLELTHEFVDIGRQIMTAEQFNLTYTDKNGMEQTKKGSALDIWNKTQGRSVGREKRAMGEGFFWKMRMTPEEAYQVAHTPELLAGSDQTGGIMGVLKHFGHSIKRDLTDFDEREYDGEAARAALLIPIKGLGSTGIDTTFRYTRDLAFSTMQGLANAVKKKHMDEIAIVGQGVLDYLNVKQAKEGKDYTNTISHFENKFIKTVIGVNRHTKWSTSPFVITFKDEYGNNHSAKISFDKVLQKLSRLASYSVMPLRLFQPIGTGLQALITLARDITTNVIFSKVNKGMHDEYKDYNLSAFGASFKEVMKLGRDVALGEPYNNKAFLFMRENGYLPVSYTGFVERSKMVEANMKLFSKDMMYIPQTATEDTITYLTLVTQLKSQMHTGVDTRGNTVTKSMWDWYEVEDSKLVWKGGLRGYEINKMTGQATEPIYGLTDREVAHMKAVYERIQGGYRAEELAAIEAYIPGQALMALKRWLPRLFLSTIQSKSEELLLGAYGPTKDGKFVTDKDGNKVPILQWYSQTRQSKYLIVAKAIGTILTFNQKKFLDFKNLAPNEQKVLIDAILTILMLAGSMLAYAYGFDDDEQETSEAKWVKRYLIDNVSQHYNALALYDNVINIGNTLALQKAYGFVDKLATLSISIAAQDYTQRGDLKGLRQFLREVPFVGSMYGTYRYIEKSTSTGLYDLK